MYDNKRILALIPARGGSKGIKNKNIIDLCGKPLIAYTIEAGKNSTYIDDVIVSTDSELIAATARIHGANVPFMRPAALALDTSKTIDSVLHAIKELEKNGSYYDILILLQPTQPLRTAEDIDHAIEHFFINHAKSLVSVSPVNDSPVLIRQLETDGHLAKLLTISSTVRRQDMNPYYVVNGCIYINYMEDLSAQTSFNDNEYGFIMDKAHSVDIDELSDLAMAKYYLNRTNIL